MKDYKVTVSEIKKQGNVLLLKFSLDEPMDFIPGQFVMIKYRDDKGEFKRSYSIASDPEHKDSFELCIGIKEGGRGSNMIKDVKVGDELDIFGPMGKFHIDDHDNEIIFVAGGTGLAPLRSMLKHLLNIHFPHKITLFYSFRDESCFLYREELELLDKDHPSFRMIPIATQDATWKGETQYIQDIFSKYITDSKEKDVYACGPVVMVDAVFNRLKELGFDEEQLHREIWSQ